MGRMQEEHFYLAVLDAHEANRLLGVFLTNYPQYINVPQANLDLRFQLGNVRFRKKVMGGTNGCLPFSTPLLGIRSSHSYLSLRYYTFLIFLPYMQRYNFILKLPNHYCGSPKIYLTYTKVYPSIPYANIALIYVW